MNEDEQKIYGFAVIAGRQAYLSAAACVMAGIKPAALLYVPADDACPATRDTVAFEGWCLGWQGEQTELLQRRDDDVAH